MTTLFVTGAASGIGKALTTRALARGDRVIACDLAAIDLPAQANLLPLQIDLGSTESVAAAFAKTDEWLNGAKLNAVVNCGGICPLGAIEVQPIEIIQRVLNINAVGSARILQQALPRLRGHGGRVILMSSLWGKVSGPMLSAYCASKFAIEALADTARRETHGQNVHIAIVEPGPVRTQLVVNQVKDAKAAAAKLPSAFEPIYGNLYRSYAKMIEKNASGGSSAEQCAAVIERAISASKPKTRYTVGPESKALTSLGWLLPDRTLD
ncbi:MAG: SDR family NAD(P)-dependent oxidoreductase, partial [Caulobacterales bacterium]